MEMSRTRIVQQRVRLSLLPLTVVSGLALIIYLVTENVLFPAVIVGGALAGAVLALAGDIQAATPAEESRTGMGKAQTSPRVLLLHDRLAVRFAALVAVGTLVFLSAWSVGYFLLSEGILRGAGMQPAAVLESRGATLLEEWLTILAWNLALPVAIPILGNLLLRIKGYPLGYLFVLISFVQYGLTLGTNSFAIPYAERMAPSLAILGRAAPYEMAAYLLIVAATYSLSRFEITDFARGTLERVSDAPRSLSHEAWIGLALGLLLLVLAGLREASMIIAL